MVLPCQDFAQWLFSIVSDEEMVQREMLCFLFNKRGRRVIGSFYDSSTYGEVGVCIAGTVNGSTISGEAVEWIQDLNVQLPEVYAKDQVAAWDQNGYLKLARGAVLSQNQLSGH